MWASCQIQKGGCAIPLPLKSGSPLAQILWLREFWGIYGAEYGFPPRLDAVGCHCYGVVNTEFSLWKCRRYIDDFVAFAREHGIPEVWVTEFAYCSPEFLVKMRAYYEAIPEVKRIAWFQVTYEGSEPWAPWLGCNSSLADYETGELTELGNAYARSGW